MITRITVDVHQPIEYTGKDIVLGNGGFKISGKITDKATTLPLANIRVGCWNDDFEIWADTSTDANGIYLLTNLPPGEEVDICVEPEFYYAYMGIEEFEFEADINNLNFALPAGGTLCGKVLGADTAQPMANVEIEYDNERYNTERNTFTNADGTFCLTQLPPGIAEVKAMPDVDSGYAWNLPWGADLVNLKEGEYHSERIIFLEKGALVHGYIKDADGDAFNDIEYYYTGKKCDGWDYPDVNGFYQIRLPVGTYIIESDDQEEFGSLPATVTITNINNPVNVPDIIFYSEETGGQISGHVNNPGGYAKTGYFSIMAFEAGTILDQNISYTFPLTAETEMENAGPFSLANLPPDANYDIYLAVESETPDERQSLTIRDFALNVALDSNNISLDYNSTGNTIRGSVKNLNGQPVIGATALLFNSAGDFKGCCKNDANGFYAIYNVPDGNYTITAIHSKYANASTVIDVNGADANVPEIVMLFDGGKEGPDLNGNGVIDLFDIAELSNQWLDSGINEADFNQDGIVNFFDWLPITDNWLWKAIWLNE